MSSAARFTTNGLQFGEIGLFGGAIKLHIPEDFIDASQFRQVPDNQEVFVASDTSAVNDNSIIIELVEKLDIDDVNVSPENADKTAVRSHYEEIASINSSISSPKILQEEVLHVPKLPYAIDSSATAYMITGVQIAEKWGRNSTSDMTYLILTLAVIRLPENKTDMLLSFNSAVHCEESMIRSFTEDANIDSSVLLRIERLQNTCKHVVQTLEVVDFGLFAD
ncbi:hypothetical protein V1512DRAFT_208276 [Lipomyces arxii]|uniref:uncharacterized protein n=1 Tax=Lipomyces arxii TaxID=56418 RepID=UPI0034CE3CF3